MSDKAYLDFMAQLELEEQKIDRLLKKEIQEISEGLNNNVIDYKSIKSRAKLNRVPTLYWN